MCSGSHAEEKKSSKTLNGFAICSAARLIGKWSHWLNICSDITFLLIAAEIDRHFKENADISRTEPRAFVFYKKPVVFYLYKIPIPLTYGGDYTHRTKN